MTITKKDIDVAKIKMTWDYVSNEVDIYSRKYLQYLVILLTFILAVWLAAVTGSCNEAIAITITVLLLIPALYFVYKMRRLSVKLKNSLVDLLDALDKLK